jgi:hypothetical protein
LVQRVLPFAGLIRKDDFGRWVVIPENSIFVTRGTDRRSTGTHYTPRSLTEPIVKHTLDPLVYVGLAEGKPEEEWQLKSPKDILWRSRCAIWRWDPAPSSCRRAATCPKSWSKPGRRCRKAPKPGEFIKTPEGRIVRRRSAGAAAADGCR